MKTKKIVVIIVALLTIGLQKSYGQPDSSTFDFKINYIIDNQNINGYDTIYFHEIVLDVIDTQSISLVNVKVGTSQGASNIVDYSFVFDINTMLPIDFFYDRDGNQIKLIVGKRLAGIYYYKVSLTDINNNESLPKSWNNWTN